MLDYDISLKNTNLKLQPHLPGANELNQLQAVHEIGYTPSIPFLEEEFSPVANVIFVNSVLTYFE